MTDEGKTLHLAEPLLHPHYGEFFSYPGQGDTDIRAVVMTKKRNVRIQGDEWSEVQLFGCRTGSRRGRLRLQLPLSYV